MRLNKNLGFTLIELLVVISIIGILTTIVMVNVAGVRERARDAQRKSDISQIQKALEMYKGNQSPPQYPESLSDLVSDYLPFLLADPTTDWTDYSYVRARVEGDNLTYQITACLENKSDPQKDSNQDNCSASCKTDSGGVCYTRNEP